MGIAMGNLQGLGGRVLTGIGFITRPERPGFEHQRRRHHVLAEQLLQGVVERRRVVKPGGLHMHTCLGKPSKGISRVGAGVAGGDVPRRLIFLVRKLQQLQRQGHGITVMGA